MKIINEFNKKIILTNNSFEAFHSFIKLIVSNNNVNVYVFNNIMHNLISKNFGSSYLQKN